MSSQENLHWRPGAEDEQGVPPPLRDPRTQRRGHGAQCHNQESSVAGSGTFWAPGSR